jgi:cell volume regulation protein A
VRLPGDLRSLLELESGSNDPMAVFLTVGMIGLIQNPQASPLGLIPAFVWQMAVGAALGCVMGALASAAVNRARLEYEGLYPALTVGIVLLTYGLADAARANPFLAVYLAAIVMRRQDFLHKRSLIRFHDGLAWLMQIVMFLALGLQVFPSQLPAVAGTGLAISLFLMLVARPVAVVATLWPARVPWRQQALIAWVGLRGAAPIILGTFPLVAGIPEAARLFDIVFFIVLTSALVQGTSVPWVARLLGLSSPDAPAAADPLDLIATGERDFHEVRVAPVAGVTGKRIVELGLPAGTLIVAIHRNGSTIVPSGGTAIREGDRLLVLSTPEDAARVRTLLEAEG